MVISEITTDACSHRAADHLVAMHPSETLPIRMPYRLLLCESCVESVRADMADVASQLFNQTLEAEQ